ncbi:MAG: TRAP transporter substrate-binding protein DctP [Pseudomonadales bacterium]
MKLKLLLLCFFVTAIPAQAKVLKIATLSPEGSSWMKTMRTAAGDVEQATEGRVKLKFYPGGVMGNDAAVLRKIRIKQLHGAAVPGGSLRKFYPDVELYSLPLKFKSLDEVDYVRSRMDSKIVDGLEQGGFVTFGLGEGGLAYMMTDTAVTSVAQLQKKKVWVPSNDPSALNAVQAFDIKPFPLDLSNVLVSLQTGMVNTVATSPIGAIALQWHTHIEHITDVPLMYFFAVLAVDKKMFDKLSANDQSAMRTIMGKAFKEIDAQNRRDNLQAFAALTKQGIQVESLNEAELKDWYGRAAQAEQKLIKQGTVSKQAADQLNKYLEEFRSQQ